LLEYGGNIINFFIHQKGTLRISGVALFGPLDEKEATMGAKLSLNSVVL
jgi:hypothetical protein